MATSGTRSFNLDVAEVIEEAYERCGLEVRSGYDAVSARRSLNLLLTEWINRGLNLWTVSQATLTVTQGQAQETLSSEVADLLDVSLRRDGKDLLMSRISRGSYADFPDKTTQGRPSQYYFDRQINPVINLWPAPENSTDQVVYYYVRRIEDAGAFTNDMAVPYRFYPCMVAGLAYYLAVKRAPEKLSYLKPLYEEEFTRASEEDEDRVSFFVRPDRFDI